MREIIAADLTFTGGRFERDVKVAITPDGRIDEVGRDVAGTVTTRLAGRALMPGFVNAHSHAFQRGLRGLGETFPEGAGSFWSWREEMYRLVEQMTPERMHTLCVQAFSEMRAAGITTVGEFHYLHHAPGSEAFAFDAAVLAAAREVGLRIVLLQAFYRTGAIAQPLAGGQKQFATPSLDAFWRQFDQLAARLHEPTQSLGVVAHSIRAADIDDIAQLHAESQQRGLVFHMHVEEQTAEIDACVEHYGRRPMELLLERLDIDQNFTAVHCTHTDDGDMAQFCATGGNVCICPLTEANLGDGLANVPHIVASRGHISLGTDSNARISMLEEMRWLEYGQRLRFQQRGAIRLGSRWDLPVLQAGTAGGARSLGLEAGALEPGHLADLLTIDLAAPSLRGADEHTLLAALLCGGADDLVVGTAVGGIWDH